MWMNSVTLSIDNMGIICGTVNGSAAQVVMRSGDIS